jgi:hypothetical protein
MRHQTRTSVNDPGAIIWFTLFLYYRTILDLVHLTT